MFVASGYLTQFDDGGYLPLWNMIWLVHNLKGCLKFVYENNIGKEELQPCMINSGMLWWMFCACDQDFKLWWKLWFSRVSWYCRKLWRNAARTVHGCMRSLYSKNLNVVAIFLKPCMWCHIYLTWYHLKW